MADKAMVGVLAIGALAAAVAMGAIVFPAWYWGRISPTVQNGGIASFVVLALALWASSFITVLTSGAVVAAAMMRADGQDPTVGQALAVAWSRRGPLAAWATVSTLVGLASRALERFGSRVSRATARGDRWGVATIFAVPLIIAEGTMPVETVRRSASMVKNTFGRTILSQIRLSWVWVVAMVAALLVAAYGVGAVVVGVDTADPIEIAGGALVALTGLLIFLFACVTRRR